MGCPKSLPGVPDCAVAMAWRSAGTMARTVRTETHALQSVLKSESWSMSCSAPRPCGEKPKMGEISPEKKKKKSKFGP